MNPSTEDILKEIQKTPAEIVYVRPTTRISFWRPSSVWTWVEDKKVVVLQAKTVPQGISAMIAMNPDGEEAENTAAMEEAMGQVTTMEITYAARDSSFDGNAIQAGDYLLLVDNQLFGTEKSMETALEKLAQESQERGGEFISIFYGEGVQQGEAEQALAQFEAACPEAEITLLEGRPAGLPLFDLCGITPAIRTMQTSGEGGNPLWRGSRLFGGGERAAGPSAQQAQTRKERSFPAPVRCP